MSNPMIPILNTSTKQVDFYVPLRSLFSVGGSIGGLTPGSVIFGSGTGTLAQDNANFSWDDSLNVLTVNSLTEITPTLLKLDQTTPQTITGGVPLMTTAVDGDGSQNQLVNKEYVDLVASGLELTLFLSNNALSPVLTNFYSMSDVEDAAATIDGTALSNGQNQLDTALQWATPTTLPHLTTIYAGIYDIHFHGNYTKSAGTHTVKVYFKLFYCDSDGANEVQIGSNSEASDALNQTTSTEHTLHLVVTSDVAIDTTKRLKLKTYVNDTSSSGTATVHIDIGGTNNSHISIKVPAIELTSIFVPYTGGNQDVNLGAHDLTVGGDITISGGDITLGTSKIFSGGDTTSLNLIDAIDATTESTLESALDIGGEVTSTGMGNTVIGDSIAVTSWNLTTPTITTSATVTDGATIGLGSGKGLIQFDDETTDYISLMNANVGIGTTAPDKKLEINTGAATGGIRLTYNDADGSATVYSDFLIASTGDLEITTTGGDISFGNENLSTTGTLGAGATTLVTGSAFKIGTTQWNSGDSIDGTKVANADLGEIGVSSGVWSVENAAVIGKVLTGYTSGAGTVAATDTILQAINKLNGNDATNANLTGEVTSVGNATTISDSIAVSSWNLTTPTLTTSATVTDGFTLGLGAGKGLIQFDDETTDFISFSNCNVGIGLTTPGALIHLASDTSGADGKVMFQAQRTSTLDGLRLLNYDGTSPGVWRWQYSNDLSAWTDIMSISQVGNVGIGLTDPTAALHLKAGTATASTSPLKFTSGTLNTTAEAGAMEFVTDTLSFTITTGAARKTIAFTDSAITSSMYIGTTQVALNRASAALTLAGITLTTPDIGTPSAGNLANCTALPIAGLTASTSTALGVGSIELGHASDTTLQRVSAGVASIEGQTIITGNKLEMPTAIGDLLYSTDGNSWSKVAMGTAGQTLKCAMDSYTKLLLHMDDAGLSDSSGTSKAITLVGGAARSATQSKFGGYSAYFDGTGDYLTTPDHADFDFSGGVWTIDCWVYLDLTNNATIFYQDTTDYNDSISCMVTSGGAMDLAIRAGSSVVVNCTSAAGVVTASTWTHIEFCENGDTYKVFVNGVDRTNSGGTDTSRAANFTGVPQIGRWGTQATGLIGYVDEFRVSKGICRHTANFTVMASAYNPIPEWTSALPNGTTATTQAKSDNSTKLATTAYVESMSGFYVGSFTRDISLTTDLAITSVGFTPRLILVFTCVDNTNLKMAMAMATTTGSGNVRGISAYGTDAWATVTNIIWFQDGSNYIQGYIKSWDANGFTIGWSKEASPTGTATINYVAFK